MRVSWRLFRPSGTSMIFLPVLVVRISGKGRGVQDMRYGLLEVPFEENHLRLSMQMIITVLKLLRF